MQGPASAVVTLAAALAATVLPALLAALAPAMALPVVTPSAASPAIALFMGLPVVIPEWDRTTETTPTQCADISVGETGAITSTIPCHMKSAILTLILIALSRTGIREIPASDRARVSGGHFQ